MAATKESLTESLSTNSLSTESSGRRLTILSLPTETLRDIFDYCDFSQLVCLAPVSKRFHKLASETIYRHLHFTLPYHCTKLGEDTLAACLNTFTTSDYDYAQYVREFCLDGYGSHSDADQSIASYVYTESCGKFLNNLLLLSLRKARGLEIFVWDVRIELSRPLYKVLHQIDTLTAVHIRLQKGPSMYEGLASLPLSPPSSAGSSTTNTPMGSVHSLPPFPQSMYQPPPLNSFLPPPPSLFYTPPNFPAPTILPQKSHFRSKAAKSGRSRPDPPTFSGFKNLKCLSILDIDSLDILSEIKTSVRNSSGTLTTLYLSFSEDLASKARKPISDPDSDDSDVDGTALNAFINGPTSTVWMPTDNAAPSGLPPPTNSKIFHAQEERQKQESALSRIFDLEPFLLGGQPKKPRSNPDKETSGSNSSADEDGHTTPAESSTNKYIKAIRDLSENLMSSKINGDAAGDAAGSAFTAEQQEALDMMEAAARKFAASDSEDGGQNKKKIGAGKEEEAKDTDDSGQDADTEAETSATSAPAARATSGPPADDSQAHPAESSLFRDDVQPGPSKSKGHAAESNPDDIDVEAPEGQLVLEEGSVSDKEGELASEMEPEKAAPRKESVETREATLSETQRISSGDSNRLQEVNKLAINIAAQRRNFQALLNKLTTLEQRAQLTKATIETLSSGGVDINSQYLSSIEKQEDALHRDVRHLSEETRIVAAEVRDIGAEAKHVLETADAASTAAAAAAADDALSLVKSPKDTGMTSSNRQLVDKYVRLTRGLALEELALCFIPTRASVLSKAIDIRSLKSITLLNVGPQAPIWTMFAKENKVEPLPLKSIFTDNVSFVLLKFIAQLKELHELIMLEHEAKHKPLSLAPSTTTTMNDIRRFVLKKHASTLEILIVNNTASQDWDADEATVKLLGQRATKLEELAISMNVPAMHKLLQYMPGFTSLKALHITRLRNDDTCGWVLQESKRFIRDTLTHYPHLKLEWLAVDNSSTVDHIKRVKIKKPSQKASSSSKGKEKALNGNSAAAGTANSMAGKNASEDDESSDSDDSDNSSPRRPTFQRVKLVTEGCHIHDIWDVRIFDREVTSGRL